jgi:hypothetical protein
MKIAGIVLLVLGGFALMYGGLRYTSRDPVLDVGPLHASAEHRHNIPIAPMTGVAMLVAGAALLFAGGRRHFR